MTLVEFLQSTATRDVLRRTAEAHRYVCGKATCVCDPGTPLLVADWKNHVADQQTTAMLELVERM